MNKPFDRAFLAWLLPTVGLGLALMTAGGRRGSGPGDWRQRDEWRGWRPSRRFGSDGWRRTVGDRQRNGDRRKWGQGRRRRSPLVLYRRQWRQWRRRRIGDRDRRERHRLWRQRRAGRSAGDCRIHPKLMASAAAADAGGAATAIATGSSGTGNIAVSAYACGRRRRRQSIASTVVRKVQEPEGAPPRRPVRRRQVAGRRQPTRSRMPGRAEMALAFRAPPMQRRAPRPRQRCVSSSAVERLWRNERRISVQCEDQFGRRERSVDGYGSRDCRGDFWRKRRRPARSRKAAPASQFPRGLLRHHLRLLDHIP